MFQRYEGSSKFFLKLDDFGLLISLEVIGSVTIWQIYPTS